MRVALVNPVFWPEVRRGSERLAHEVGVRLARRGFEPVLVCGASKPGREVVERLDVVRVPRLPGEGRLRRRMFEEHLTAIPATRVALEALKPQVVLALHPTSAAAVPDGVPFVLAYMGIPHRRALANRRRRLQLTLDATRRASAVTALSRHAAEAFDRWLGVEAVSVPPGVDLDAFSPGATPRDEPPSVLFAADPSEPRKRHRLLLDALARIPSAKLVEGGSLAKDDLIAANRRASASVLPSTGEAFGLVCLEALACGTPAVAPNDEVVSRPELGAVFTGDDPGALAAAILHAIDLAKDPATRHRCRTRAEAFSWDATADRYAELLRRAA